MFFSSKDKSVSKDDLQAVHAQLLDIFGHNRSDLIQVKLGLDGAIECYFPFVVDSVWPSTREKLEQQHPKLTRFEKHYNIPIFDAKQSPVNNVKNIIAVASGKGGVGKSASALNLAIALRLEGARVGILDADIYGPSIPIMLGTQNQQPKSPDDKHMIPIEAHNLVSNSIGYLVKNDHASIWRGPMASKALTQLLVETRWPALDYLIVDMPPGTGDIQLTMCQQLPLTAAVVVTTPQDIALADAAKGIAMFEKLDIPVLGLIENMSYFECSNCHHKSAIFSEKGAQKLSEKYALPILAQVPLNPLIREFADSGRSLLHELPEHEVSIIYRQAAMDMSRHLCETAKLMPIAANMASNIEITRLD